MGDVPLDWQDPGQFPPKGGPSACKYTAKEGRGGQVDILTSERGNEGSGDGRGGEVRPPLPEYLRSVYHHSSNTGAMYSGGATAGGAGVDAMLGSGWP